ncbi:NUDIX domain-containing protein [Spirosoma aureum]|uniref:NUDIX domain-containing protein n=1 Tax=Spirosoma aureum TaxID=2692134 RepID=A0A6G9AYQ9_9BACT|nr:NUDIX domain-containing protein [Spirosoma aureum]QIP17333.1 NUDIX domain-containing protein [Spirosoma aureum]
MKKFNPNEYIAHLSIDCVVFGYQNNELNVLISKFRFGEGSWSLPGGYILKTEGIDKAAKRILRQRTGLAHIYLEQFHVFGDENRIIRSANRPIVREDLRQFGQGRFDEEAIDWITSRFVCIGFYALVDIAKVNPQPGEFDEYLEWRNLNDIPQMIHDHSEILTMAIETLRQNLDQKLIGFNLLPETFTMREVQQLYEAVYDRSFPINNFQKKILDLNVLERLHKRYTGAANTAPYLYRFRK